MPTILGNKRVRLKNKIQMMVKNCNLILSDGKEIYIIDNYSPELLECLNIWRKGGTVREIEEQISFINGSAFATYSQALKELIEKEFFEDMDIESNLEPFDQQFWSRTIDYFTHFENEEISRFDYLNKLRKSKVLLVGIGGIGSWVLYQLLCMGVGEIYLVDGDKVEMSNLNRSILYNHSDVGKWKVDCAIKRAKQFTPTTKVDGHIGFLNNSTDLIPYLNEVDLVISCADKPYWYIQKWVADACIKKEVPFITASGGKIGPFYITEQDACRMCLFAEIIEKNPSFAETLKIQKELPTSRPGVLVSKVGLMASYLANEVFLYLTGLGTPNTVNGVWQEGKGFTSKITPVEKHTSCQSCGKATLSKVLQ